MVSYLKEVLECGILPIVRFDKKEQAVPFAEAIRKGGMPFAEVLCRTGAALDGIRAITDKYPDYMVGAGTILDEGMAEAALEAGAKFLVLPGFDPRLVRFAMERGALVIPGCVTPGEIQQAMRLGVRVLKFFPAELYGGISALKELYGPYPDAVFIVTSVPENKVRDYLDCPNVGAVGGLFMYDENNLRLEDYDAITEQIRTYKKENSRIGLMFHNKSVLKMY